MEELAPPPLHVPCLERDMVNSSAYDMVKPTVRSLSWGPPGSGLGAACALCACFADGTVRLFASTEPDGRWTQITTLTRLLVEYFAFAGWRDPADLRPIAPPLCELATTQFAPEKPLRRKISWISQIFNRDLSGRISRDSCGVPSCLGFSPRRPSARPHSRHRSRRRASPGWRSHPPWRSEGSHQRIGRGSHRQRAGQEGGLARGTSAHRLDGICPGAVQRPKVPRGQRPGGVVCPPWCQQQRPEERHQGQDPPQAFRRRHQADAAAGESAGSCDCERREKLRPDGRGRA